MSYYSSHTQPRRSVDRSHPPIPPLSTLPRFTSQGIACDTRPFSASTTPRHRTPETPQHLTREGDLTLTKRILSTAGHTGSTQDLRLLLHDALALTEKLDSVSSSVGRGSARSSNDYHRLSNTSAYPKSPGAYSETGSVFRSHSMENGLDRDPANEHYETSASLAASIATPVRKNIHPNVQNGHSSPPINGTPVHRGNSPLLQDKRTSSSDYALPKSTSTSRSVSQRSTLAGEESPLRTESQGDNIDEGLDCIAQLEALEKELHSYKPASYPDRSSKDHSLESSQDSSVESHYEVDPHYRPPS